MPFPGDHGLFGFDERTGIMAGKAFALLDSQRIQPEARLAVDPVCLEACDERRR